MFPTPGKSERVVLCMKWGTLFPSTYVNVLYNAVQAYLPLSHRFVCLTNEPQGLDPRIETFPIPDLGIPEYHWYHGAWPKIAVFLPQLYDLHGECLFIDLDSVIVGDLSVFFNQSVRLTGLDGGDNWRPNASGHAGSLGTGVFAFTLGGLSHVTQQFAENQTALIEQHKLEQAFVHAAVPDVQFWEPEWVISFKRHLRQPVGLDRVVAPKTPPVNARIVAFHGDPRPIDLTRSGVQHWAKFPRYGRGSVGWVQEYWDAYDQSGQEAV